MLYVAMLLLSHIIETAGFLLFIAYPLFKQHDEIKNGWVYLTDKANIKSQISYLKYLPFLILQLILQGIWILIFSERYNTGINESILILSNVTISFIFLIASFVQFCTSANKQKTAVLKIIRKAGWTFASLALLLVVVVLLLYALLGIITAIWAIILLCLGLMSEFQSTPAQKILGIMVCFIPSFVFLLVPATVFPFLRRIVKAATKSGLVKFADEPGQGMV